MKRTIRRLVGIHLIVSTIFLILGTVIFLLVLFNPQLSGDCGCQGMRLTTHILNITLISACSFIIFRLIFMYNDNQYVQFVVKFRRLYYVIPCLLIMLLMSLGCTVLKNRVDNYQRITNNYIFLGRDTLIDTIYRVDTVFIKKDTVMQVVPKKKVKPRYTITSTSSLKDVDVSVYLTINDLITYKGQVKFNKYGKVVASTDSIAMVESEINKVNKPLVSTNGTPLKHTEGKLAPTKTLENQLKAQISLQLNNPLISKKTNISLDSSDINVISRLDTLKD